MSRLNFWDPQVKVYLIQCGRQDLVDSGDALAERVAALMLTTMNRLKKYSRYGDLYNGKGGRELIETGAHIGEYEQFVSERLRQEIDALECILSIFDDFPEDSSAYHY
jgi:hypothetical protein